MVQLLRFSEDGRVPPVVHFCRTELKLLFNLYSRRVAAGEWRDYAIAAGPDRAVFAVFRHAHERPLFTIAKLAGGTKGECYVVASGAKRLRQAPDLAEALRALDGLRVVR